MIHRQGAEEEEEEKFKDVVHAFLELNTDLDIRVILVGS